MAEDAGLSLAVRLGALNDFLEPSQDCVLDLEKPNLIKLSGKESSTSGVVNVADCLACSGCVTTAETVLLNTHNYRALQEILERGAGKFEGSPAFEASHVVLSISAVSEAAIMARYRIENRASFYSALANNLAGIDLICCTDLAEQLTTHHQPTACRLPVSSHCPSVVLYAEKFEHHVIPYIDLTPSVQCWQGAVVKSFGDLLLRQLSLGEVNVRRRKSEFIAAGGGELAKQIYHITVNSCADKKLEVFRPEFEGLVDLSLTTDEFLSAVTEAGLDIGRPTHPSSVATWDLAARLSDYFGYSTLPRYDLQRSCGPHVARVLEKQASRSTPRNTGANADQIGWPAYQCLSAGGLRNLKNIMAKHRMANLDNKTIDLLACPKGGCFSGAGHTNVYKATEAVRSRAEEIFVNTMRHGCAFPNVLINIICQRRPDFAYRLRETVLAANSMIDW